MLHMLVTMRPRQNTSEGSRVEVEASAAMGRGQPLWPVICFGIHNRPSESLNKQLAFKECSVE